MLGSEFTVNVTAVLVTDPAVLVTTHSNSVPLSAAEVTPVVYVVPVAPGIVVHVLPLLVLSCH